MTSKIRGKKNEYGIYIEIPPMPGEIHKEHLKGFAMHIVLTPEQEEWLKRFYANTPTSILMEMSRLKHNTLIRHAMKLGLRRTKRQRSLMQKWVVHTKTMPACEKNGFYDYLRNERGMGEQCEKRKKELFEQGWHPIKEMQKNNPELYAKKMAERSAYKKDLFHKESIRQEYGLTRRTHLHIPEDKFTRTACDLRWKMKKLGYILGDMRPEFGERWIIYYDNETERHERCEQHAKEQGFSIQPLTD